jgi:hypothetical protein
MEVRLFARLKRWKAKTDALDAIPASDHHHAEPDDIGQAVSNPLCGTVRNFV